SLFRDRLSLSLLQRLDLDVLERHLAVIPLQQERAGLGDFAVEGGAGRTIDLGVVDHLFAVPDQRDAGFLRDLVAFAAAAFEDDIKALPFLGRLGHVLARRYPAIDRAAYRVRQFFHLLAVFLDQLRLDAEGVVDLNLVTALEIDAAVARPLELDVQ